MKNEQPKAGRPGETPGETRGWSRWDGSAESRQNGYLQGEGHVFAEGPEQDRRIGRGQENSRPDDLIAQDVHEHLMEDALLDPTSLSVTVENGEVMLEGYVAQLTAKERAEEIVLDIEGVAVCRNNLRIAPERH